MEDNQQTCPSCGARIPDEMDRCELCGTPADTASEPSGDVEEELPDGGSKDVSRTPGTASDREQEGGRPVFCNQCGWENPGGARYCSQCGSELQDLEPETRGARPVSADLPAGEDRDPDEDKESEEETAPEDESGEQVAMGRQIGLVVGGALVVILIFFGVTQWSAQYEWSSESEGGTPESQAAAQGRTPPSAAGGQRPMSGGNSQGRGAPTDLRVLVEQSGDSLAGSMAEQVDSLEALVEKASGTEKRQRQAELVNLLIGAGQPGRAAIVQREIAEATGTVEARRRMADLLYRWMQKFQQQGQRQQVFEVARHAAEAYAAVSKERPDDLDARTRMGESYLLTNNPMRGIQAINKVLEDDSTFVPARFQKGLALLQINRVDQAIQQFEKVRQFAEEGSPFYRQADRALRVIEEQRGSGSSTTSSSGGE